MDVYFFDCDDTLYAYDFHKRLPLLASLTGSTQYHLASTWWAGGHEHAAEAGEYLSSDEYLAAFREVTGVELTLAQWQQARKAAMTPVPGAIAAMKRAASFGTVSLLSNNPIPFKDSLPILTPEIWDALDGNDLISAVLGARKPEPRVYTRALSKFGVDPADAILFDDSAANVDGAINVGMSGFQLTHHGRRFDIEGLNAAIDRFATRKANRL